MDWTKLITYFIENYGGWGIAFTVVLIILIIGLPIVLPLLLNHNTKKLENILSEGLTKQNKQLANNLTELAEKLSETVTEQNNQLIINMQETQNKLLDHFINQKTQHDEGMSKRKKMLTNINQTLRRLLEGSGADRVALIEFHNSKENLNGLPFLWYDIQAEWFKRGIPSISQKTRNMQAGNLAPIIDKIEDSDENWIILNEQELDDLYNYSPVLHQQLVEELEIKTMIYIGLYSSENKLAGLLAFEFTENFDISSISPQLKARALQVAQGIEDMIKTCPISDIE